MDSLPNSIMYSNEKTNSSQDFLHCSVENTNSLQSISSDNDEHSMTNDQSSDESSHSENKNIPNTFGTYNNGSEQSSESPKILNRKRKRKCEDWNVNILKKAANNGLDCNLNNGKSISKRSLGTGCINCRFKCSQRIGIIARKKIFDEFWKLGNHNQQWDYLDKSTVIIHHTEKPNGNSPRKKIARQYFLSVEDKKIKVCQTMFLHTFGISDKWLQTIQLKKSQSTTGQIILEDGRGKHLNRPKKIKPEVTQSVKTHIESYVKIDSNCGASSRQYISSDLSLSKMYMEYKEEMINLGKNKMASQHHYRDVFRTYYNLPFRRPKEDQCDQCTVFNNATDEEKLILQSNQDLHNKNNNYVMNCMKSDQEAAISDNSICCASFYLQKVLNVPCNQSSSFCYKTELSVYNLTVFDLATKEVDCFIWNETIGKRGTNEIASCLYMFIKKKISKGFTDFRLYSDDYGGQIRNSVIYTMYLDTTMNSSISIQHRYFVKGHIPVDGDSVHSVIEEATKDKILCTQEQWCSLIRDAKMSDSKFEVNEMNQTQIFSFSKNVMKAQWKNIPISKISSITISNGKIIFKKDSDDKSIEIKSIYECQPIQQCYLNPIQLDEGKKGDSNSPVENELVKDEFHDFYFKMLE